MFYKKNLTYLLILKLFFLTEYSFSKEYSVFIDQTESLKNYKSKFLAKDKSDSTFERLPEIEEIINKNKFGKVDPFTLNEESENVQFGGVKLLGVFSDSSKNYALISFNNVTGQIEEGNIGGINTSSLPNNVILKKINVESSYIILEFNKKEYKLSI